MSDATNAVSAPRASPSQLPFIVVKRRGRLHRLADLIDDWHVVRILNAIGAFGIVLAVTGFGIDLFNRAEDRIVRSWSVVITKAPGNSGKREALEYLNSEPWYWPFKRRVPLFGIDLSYESHGSSVYLSGVDLSSARLLGANFAGAHLAWANFSGANLSSATFSGALLIGVNLSDANLAGAELKVAGLSNADLTNANLRAADLGGAILNDAILESARLSQATLTNVTLTDAKLTRANLHGANLSGADLSGADLSGADLTGADLSGADLTGADLKYVNLSVARNLTADDIAAACLDASTTLPQFLEDSRPSPCPTDQSGNLIRR